MQSIRPILLIALVASLVATPSCSPLTPATPASPPSTKETRIADEVHNVINHYRASQGLGPLTRHKGLDKLAHNHSDYLRVKNGGFGIYGNKISHFKFEWRAQQAATQYGFRKLGENVAFMKVKPQSQAHHLLILWVASDGHRKNIHGDWTHSGVGIAITENGDIIATQLFGSKGESSSTSQ